MGCRENWVSPFYLYITITPASAFELINYGPCPILWMMWMQLPECTHCVRGMSGSVRRWSKSVLRTVETHAAIWRTYVWLHRPAAAELGRDHNLLVPPQILTFPICCVATAANRTDTTQRLLINHDYEAPLAAASLGSEWINSIPVFVRGHTLRDHTSR